MREASARRMRVWRSAAILLLRAASSDSSTVQKRRAKAPCQANLTKFQKDLLFPLRIFTHNSGEDGRSNVIEDKLAKLRRKQGLSQQEVADDLGVSRQTISNWEAGQGAPALDKARELARLFRVSLDDLVSDDVEVVTGSGAAAGRDLHVLLSLKGSSCRMAFADANLALTVGSCNPLMKVLDVHEDWIKVEYERAAGRRKRDAVVQLIEVDAVEMVCIERRDAS